MWKRIKSIFHRPSKEPLFSGVRNDDAEMRGAYAAAAASIDELVAHVLRGGELTCAAKLRFKDPGLSKKLGEDRFVYLWLAGVELADAGTLVGTFIQVPQELMQWHQPGQRLQFERGDIFDWFVNDDGLMYGGFTMRVQRSRLPAAERDSFDEYTGVRQWVHMEVN